MIKPHQDKIERLPRWASAYISSLETAVKTLKDIPEPEDTVGYVEDLLGIGFTNLFNIKKGDTVHFNVPRPGYPMSKTAIEISKNLDDADTLRISCDGRLIVMPMASNCINVRIGE